MKISVVIPAYNEEEFLPRLLTALKNQSFSDNFEIVVADNNSTDKTAEVAKSFGAKVVTEKQQGFAFAANAAFFAANGDILVRSDSDSVPPPNWLQAVYDEFQKDPELIAIGGPIFPLESSGLKNYLYYPAAIAWMYLLRFFGQGYLFTNIAVRKDVFHELKGFRTDVYGEDTDLCLRLTKKGKVRIFPTMYVYSSVRRMHSLGMKNFFTKYIIGNTIAKARKKEVTLGLEVVRTVIPYNAEKVKGNPWIYVWLTPILLTLILCICIIYLR